MNLKFHKSTLTQGNSQIEITGSKSETNRLLLLQSLYPEIEIENTSLSDDSKVMLDALSSSSDIIDVQHAGTAMRFLTAYFSIQNGKSVILKGSSRMHERPIKILVDALIKLGAQITYLDKNGFPPLKIRGTKINKNKVSINANVSSQYISALLLIAPRLENGLELTLVGEITSLSYINMTLALLNDLEIETSFKENVIQIKNKSEVSKQSFTVESDWSSASYFYSIVALSDFDTELTLSSFKMKSIQGDAIISKIYSLFGVETLFNNNTITLIKKKADLKAFELNLINTPDIAQTIVVTSFGLGLDCTLNGLHTLKIKETNRLLALKTEIEKLGGQMEISNDRLHLESTKNINQNVKIKTYSDHRMAMAFAPLALIVPIIIEDASVVSKSYPSFWKDLKSIGFKFSE